MVDQMLGTGRIAAMIHIFLLFDSYSTLVALKYTIQCAGENASIYFVIGKFFMLVLTIYNVFLFCIHDTSLSLFLAFVNQT